MSTKDQFYEQNMKPLLDHMMEMAEKGGINIVAIAHYVEEGSDKDTVIGCMSYNSEKNGESAHIVAAKTISQRPPSFAMAVIKSADLADTIVRDIKLQRQAAANPHGVAE